jgi:SIR2-like domain
MASRPNVRKNVGVIETAPVARGERVPFEALHKALAKGKAIPFLGAGASMELRGEEEEWTLETNARFGPLGSELARRLAHLASFPEDEFDEDLARVAQYADLKIGRRNLSDGLAEVFNPSPKSTDLHRYLASFEEPLLIMTTNYDDMLESAFVAADRPFHLVVQTLGPGRKHRAWVRPAGADVGAEVNEVTIELDAATTIYKLHGSSAPPPAEDYLISEDDYLRFLQKMMSKKAIPVTFTNRMRTLPFLFIGYGLADWNLRLLLYQLKDYIEKSEISLPSWAIMHSVNDVDRRLWTARGVELFEVPLRDFVAGMIAKRDEPTGQ